MTTSPDRHLDTLSLHQLRLGELGGDALARARAHLDACAACAVRARVQVAERAAFVARPVPPAIRAARAPDPAIPWWRSLLGGLLVAATVALGVRAARLADVGPAAVDAAETRVRGALPEVEVWVRGERGPRPLRADEVVHPGDRVQLKYDPRGHSQIALAGRDGAGGIEVYTTNAPTGVGVVTAPFALTLDDVPGNQELYVLGADRPLDEATVRRAVREGVPGVDVGRVRLVKR